MVFYVETMYKLGTTQCTAKEQKTVNTDSIFPLNSVVAFQAPTESNVQTGAGKISVNEIT
jgi:hypothetical protein